MEPQNNRSSAQQSDAPAPEPGAATPAAAITEWPGAFGIFKTVAAATKLNAAAILGFNILAIMFSAINRDGNGALAFVAILIGAWTQLALVSLYLASGRGEKQTFSEAASAGIRHYVDGFIASILVVLLLAVSLLALVIPFFFVLPRLQLVMYYIVDRDMGPLEAIRASWHDSKGHSINIWGIIAVQLLFGVLVLLLVGIYLLFVYQTVFAILYLYLQRRVAVAAVSGETGQV